MVVRTYSKVWSLAAVRLGFAVGPTWVIDELEKVLLPYNLSVPTQLAGTVALDFRATMEQRVASARRGAGPPVRGARRDRPSSTCSRRARTSCWSASTATRTTLWERLLQRGVLVRDFSSWPRVEDCLRVTVGTPAENDAFLAALGEVIPEAIR